MNESRELQAQHLRELLDEHNLTSKEFYQLLHFSPVSVSHWLNGRATMSEAKAQRISELFPDYSPDYLRGISLFKDDDARASMTRTRAYQGMEFIGYTLTSCEGYGGTWTAIEDAVHPDHYRINRADKEIYLSREDFTELAREVSDYVLFRVDSMIDRGSW